MIQVTKKISVVLSLIMFCFIYGCTTSPVYQKQYAVSGAEWQSSFQPEFSIEIKDTQSNYKTYFILRHDESFPFSNIWLKLYVQAPDSEVYTPTERVDLLLATPQGKWLGKNIGNIWEQKQFIPINIKTYFTQPGIYKIKVEQIMRTDPLPSVLNVGLNIEKY